MDNGKNKHKNLKINNLGYLKNLGLNKKYKKCKENKRRTSRMLRSRWMTRLQTLPVGSLGRILTTDVLPSAIKKAERSASQLSKSASLIKIKGRKVMAKNHTQSPNKRTTSNQAFIQFQLACTWKSTITCKVRI